MPFHSKFNIKPEWKFIYLIQRFLDLSGLEILEILEKSAGGWVFNTFQTLCSGILLYPFIPFPSKARAKCFIWPISFPEGWLCILSRLNLHSWSCSGHGWVVSRHEDGTMVYHYSWVLEKYLILPNLLCETSMYYSNGNHRTEKKWMAHAEINPLPLASPTGANWTTRLPMCRK